MKKYQKISILLAVILSLVMSIVYAANENNKDLEKEAKEMTTAAITSTVEQVLEPITTSKSIQKIEEFNDKIQNKKLSQAYTPNYIVSIDSSSKQLVGIYEREAKYDLITTDDKQIAENFISAKYTEMNLPSEYKLVYLEKFDDYVWEADFQKEYDGVYNMYEAVKIFFNPENSDIVALTVFDEKYTPSSSETITSEEANSIATTYLNRSADSIKGSELTLIKSNNFYNKENTDKSIHKAWIITTQENNKIFIDAASGEIIGGDSFNE